MVHDKRVACISFTGGTVGGRVCADAAVVALIAAADAENGTQTDTDCQDTAAGYGQRIRIRWSDTVVGYGGRIRE